MKLYNKVYVPDPDGPFEVEEVGGAWIDSVSVSFAPPNSLLVLTIEELRECFKWGVDSFEDTQTPAQSFNDFLQSKGINITENGK